MRNEGLSLRIVLGLLGSILLHALCVAFLLFTTGPAKGLDLNKRRVVELEVVEAPPKPEPPKPEPPPPPEPEPPKPEPPKPKPKPRPKPPPEVVKPDTPPPPPPSNQPPPEAPPKKPVPLVTGISLSSTVGAGKGSGMRVAVGNTLYGTPDKKVEVAPEAVQPYVGAEKYIAPHKVTTLPRVAREVRVPYPEAPRQAGIEGTVKLHLTINHLGAVVKVKVIESVDPELDAAAVRALRQVRFHPATVDGDPVSTEIDYAYTFLLD
ncbi:MAG: energy transducer TonB [Deltaproteobacteria bacterium]|nr:energy transducer TonB [Deltaproteobacteria bacterium]